MTVSKKTSAAPYLPPVNNFALRHPVIININDAACTYIGVTSSLRYSISISRNLTNDLVEPEHSVRELLVLFFGASFRIIWIWVVFDKKLDIENPIIRINTAFKGCSSLEKISVLPRIYHN